MGLTLVWIVTTGLLIWAAFTYADFRWLYLVCVVLALSRVPRRGAADPIGGPS